DAADHHRVAGGHGGRIHCQHDAADDAAGRGRIWDWPPDGRIWPAMKSLWAILAVLGWCAAADGQVFDRPIALPPAEIEPLDTASAAHLENAKRFLAERQWAEAVEAIRRAEEADASRLVRVEMPDRAAGFERYVTAGEYCQWRLATLASEAPEALAHYRKLVDPLADSWFRE